MNGLTITIMTPSEEALNRLNQLMMSRLNLFLHMVRMECTVYDQFSEIACVRITPKVWKAADKTKILQGISFAIADYIVQSEEENRIRQLIRTEFSYNTEEDITKIMSYCRQMLQFKGGFSEATGWEQRALLISQVVNNLLKEDTNINIDGLLKFRLHNYCEELRDVVEYAIDEFLMEKQYQEFIALLKYFVFIQEAKIPVAHLMHKGGHEFVLLNEQLLPIDTTKMDVSLKVEVLDKDFNFEDLIVSTLITVAPQHIHIHTREPEVQVIKTIMQIFDDRAKLCDYCRVCIPVLGEHNQQDQLYT